MPGSLLQKRPERRNQAGDAIRRSMDDATQTVAGDQAFGGFETHRLIWNNGKMEFWNV